MKNSEIKTEKAADKEVEAIEYQQVTIKIPRVVIKFLEGHLQDIEAKDIEEYLENAILRQFKADIDCEHYFFSNEHIIRIYNLGPVFQSLQTANKEED